MQSNKFRGIIIYLAVILLLIFGLVSVLNLANSAANGSKNVTYSDVIKEFDELNVSGYTLDLGSGELVYVLKGSTEAKKYTVPNVSIF